MNLISYKSLDCSKATAAMLSDVVFNDQLIRTRDNSQRQLPTDHDYAVPTREYQTDQSSLKPAQAAARSVLGEKQKQRQRQSNPIDSAGLTGHSISGRVTQPVPNP